jgi:hypothetical protein
MFSKSESDLTVAILSCVSAFLVVGLILYLVATFAGPEVARAFAEGLAEGLDS